jgi:hypothetical protein
MERMIWASAFGSRFAFDGNRDDARCMADRAVLAYRGLYPWTSTVGVDLKLRKTIEEKP